MSKPGRGRVLFVLGSLAVGGTETQLALLAEGLTMRGWAVEIFLLEKSGALIERLERAGIQISDGGYASGRGAKIGRLAAVIGCEVRLFWRALRSRPDVVHGFLPLA